MALSQDFDKNYKNNSDFRRNADHLILHLSDRSKPRLVKDIRGTINSNTAGRILSCMRQSGYADNSNRLGTFAWYLTDKGMQFKANFCPNKVEG